MKSLLAIIGVLIAAFAVNYWMPKPGDVFRSAGPEDSQRQIRAFVAEYYRVLRAEQYEQAAAMHAPGYFQQLPMEPLAALKTASEVTGIPEEVTAESIDVIDDFAVAQIVIQREGIGPVHIDLVKARSRERVGTWARTLWFERIEGEWYITHPPEGSPTIEDALALLEELDAAPKK